MKLFSGVNVYVFVDVALFCLCLKRDPKQAKLARPSRFVHHEKNDHARAFIKGTPFHKM